MIGSASQVKPSSRPLRIGILSDTHNYLDPRIKGDFRSFLATATGYGTVGVRKGRPFVEVKSGAIEVRAIKTAP